MVRHVDINGFPSEELDLRTALHEERHFFEKVQVPILTISSTYRKELADKYNTLAHAGSDVVFSRAHYSMAEAVREAAKELGLTTYMSDPTNFVSSRDWRQVEFTEKVGQLMARYRLLKRIKDKIDTIVRDKLPIAKAITKPLKYMSADAKHPFISLHYEMGNQLVMLEKQVIQVVTDPHVRPQYLYSLPSDKITYTVFDEETKIAFFKEAKRQKRDVKENQIVVTGPPIDPRVAKVGMAKGEMKLGKPLHLAITTGGLGTNLYEIKEILKQLVPLIKPMEKVQLFLYAGTHRDFRNFFEDFAQSENIRIGNLDDERADIRILYEDSIIDANKNLIKYMFPWAHGVITKPSGDMAYDAAAAGCFLLFLEPWGVWEEQIQKRFLSRKIGYDLNAWKTYEQFMKLWEDGFFNQAMENAQTLPDLFRRGSFNIVKLQQEVVFIK